MRLKSIFHLEQRVVRTHFIK